MAHKLFLADDSVTIQRVIELTFADEDVTVVSVSDGQQAMQRIPVERPDIVLADVGMPRQDGYAVTRFIKGDPSLAHIPVLLLTGAFEPVDEAKARAAGCDAVLAKPFEPQMLIARVKELLAKAPAPAPLAAPAPPPEPPSPFQPAARPGSQPASAGGSAPPPRPVVERPAAGWTAPPPERAAGPAAPAPVPARPSTPEPAPSVPAQEMSLDDYFDRLDAAFANLSTGLETDVEADLVVPEVPSRQPGSGLEPEGWEKPGTDRPGVDLDLSSWMQPTPAAPGPPAAERAKPAAPAVPEPPPSRPLASPDVQPGAGTDEVRAVEPVEVDRESAPRVAQAAEAPSPGADGGEGAPALSGPAIAVSSPPAAVSREAVAGDDLPVADAFSGFLAAEQGAPIPASLAAGFGRATAASEDFVEEVTRRVIERMADRAVRDTVTDIVSQVAERVVREEIARLKASLR